MIFTEQTEQFIKDDVLKLLHSLNQTIERLQNMRKHYEEILEALE